MKFKKGDIVFVVLWDAYGEVLVVDEEMELYYIYAMDPKNGFGWFCDYEVTYGVH